MREIEGDIWEFHKAGKWVVVTTNGFIKKNGEAVMGAGIAKQATNKYPFFPKMLGHALQSYGNVPMTFKTASIGNKYIDLRIFTLPVKHNWFEKADIDLITSSLEKLVKLVDNTDIEEVYMVRPGCGNGKLNWDDVKPIIEPLLDDRFIIVEKRIG